MPFRMFWTKVHMFRHRLRGCITYSTMEPKVAIVGIDFGCKNSRVAIIESLVPEVISGEIGHTIPSYVTLAELKPHSPLGWCMQHLENVGKQVAVGQIAKYKMLRQPSDVVVNIKELIGKQFDDSSLQEMKERVHFSIIEGPKGEAWVEIHGMKFSPVEISSFIFAKLKDAVLMYQFHHKIEVVISVPAFFNEQQKEDIKLAGNRAGLDVLQLIDEPTAAALSSTTKEGFVVVFGMGAGSYSISIMHVSDGNMKVKAQSGDCFVGGDQFNNILLDHFVSRMVNLHSINIRGDKYAMATLAEVAEQVKVDLSNLPQVTVSIPCFAASAEGPVDFNITISRTEFENLVGNLTGQIKHKCQSLLKESNITEKDIAEIVLFGGMTRMPKIQSIVDEVFGQHQRSKVNPEEAVVIGSAIQAALFVEDRQEISEDAIPLSIGIESANGTFTRVIPRNTTLPTTRTVSIPAWTDYGECLRVRIFFGEHVKAHHNLFLGEIEFINNRKSHQGSVDFEVTFEIDKDYVVKVSVVDADDQLVPSDDTRKVSKNLTINKDTLSKYYVNNAVKDALFNWSGINDHLRIHAGYILNTLDDVLSAREDELPKDLCEEAVTELADLRMALDADVVLLKEKMLSARSMVSNLLNWMPSEECLWRDYSDAENENK